MPPKDQRNAVAKTKASKKSKSKKGKRRHIKNDKNRNGKRKATKTSHSHSPKCGGSPNEKERITCYVCDKKHDLSSAVKYNDHLWFYWCSCSVSALVYRQDIPTKNP